MNHINPLLYITDTDPVPEKVLDASQWFETEYIELNFDTGQGRLLQYVEWYMAQGWTVYDRHNETYYEGLNVFYRGWVRMKRRKLQSERVLNDMIREFTEAHNEGRAINDRRYDEIVTIYNVMLDRSQVDMQSAVSVTNEYASIIDAIIGNLGADFAAYAAETTGLLDGFGASRRAAIATRFDNELSKARQDLITRGMNNSTIWASVSAGIAREREKSITELEDQIIGQKMSRADRINGAREAMRSKMLAAHDRVFKARSEDGIIKPVEFRNSIISAMLNFMERRQDEYPGLDGLANIAAQLGYGEGGTVSPPT
jgi:hypothetical protein